MKPLPRVHSFELEDQPWFPAAIRDLATDYLHFVEARCALHLPALPLLWEVLEATGTERVVDLCSGAGGMIPLIQQALAADGVPVRFTLTDRYPNLPAFQAAAQAGGGAIDFVPEAVDARAVPPELRGVRTLFNGFHHFPPGEAVQVLRDAVQARQPIAIFEVSERSLSTLIPLALLTPLLVALATPFIRPFRWRRLFWTYVLPAVPLTCWWDGIISQLRAYTPAELEGLAREAGEDVYVWRTGKKALGSTPGMLTYLLGYPAGTAGD